MGEPARLIGERFDVHIDAVMRVETAEDMGDGRAALGHNPDLGQK